MENTFLTTMLPVLNLIPFFPLTQPNGQTLSNWVSLLVWIAIIGITIWGIWKLFWGNNCKKNTTKSIEKLKSIFKQHLNDNRREIAVQIQKEVPNFLHSWKEYDETLVEVTQKGGALQLRNTADASYFFNDSTLAPELINNRIITAIPGFLTGLGLLGTFLGLAIGLNGLNLSESDPEKLIKGIAFVINGAQLAFSTSVWGILFSLIFSFVEKTFIESPVRQKITDLQETIDKAFPRITAEAKLAELSDTSEQSRDLLAGLAEKIGDQLQKTMSEVSKEMVIAIRTGLGEIKENTTGQNGEVLGSLLSEFVSKFQDIAEKPGVEMKAAAEATKTALAQLAQETSVFITELRQTMDKQSERDEQRNNTLVSVVRSIEEQSTSASRELRTATEAIIERLNGVTSDVTEKLTNEGATRQKDFTASTEQLAKLMRSQTERMKDLIESNSNSVRESGQILLGLNGVATKIKETMHNLESAALSMSSATNVLDKAGSSLGQAITTGANQITQFGAIHDKIRNQFDISATGLQKNTDAFARIIETFEKVPSQIHAEHSEYLTGLKSAFQKALAEYSSQVTVQTNDRMNAWNEQTRAFITQMTEAVGQINESVVEFADNLQDIRKTAR